jgi:uncharacterized membrane protein YidH (DUF202 family)
LGKVYLVAPRELAYHQPMPEIEAREGQKSPREWKGILVSLVAAGVLAYGLLTITVMDWRYAFLPIFLAVLPAFFPFLAGIGYRKLAKRLLRMFLYGFLLGGGIGVAAGGLLFLVCVLIKLGGDAGEFVMLYIIIGIVVTCIVVGVMTSIGFYKQIWLHRREFRRETVSPLWLVAAGGIFAIGSLLFFFLIQFTI